MNIEVQANYQVMGIVKKLIKLGYDGNQKTWDLSLALNQLGTQDRVHWITVRRMTFHPQEEMHEEYGVYSGNEINIPIDPAYKDEIFFVGYDEFMGTDFKTKRTELKFNK